MKDLQDYLFSKGLDCAIFATYEKPNPNLFYFTGYVGSGFLIVPAKGEHILHVPSRDLSLAKKVKGVLVSSGKKVSEVLKSKGISTEKVGIDFTNISVADFNNLKERLSCEFFDITSFMEDLRMIKSANEIASIRKACSITDLILGEFVKNFNKFDTEEDAAVFLVYESRKRGCGLAFEPIVASGVNAAIPHHVPKGKLNSGFCVVDFGVTFNGYCSDVTRTFYFGKPSKAEEKIYYDLLDAQEKSISLVKSGLIIGEVSIESEKLTGALIHSLGHGMGIEVHEKPYVSNSTKTEFKEGMVITIEPGVYVEGKYGIRIEDDVLVTKNGREVLSKFTKKLIVL